MISTSGHVNRQEWLQSMVALATPLRLSHPRPKGAVEKLKLQNSDIDFQFVLRQGRIESRRLTNKQANETVDLPDVDFALEFDNHAVVDPSDFKAEIAKGRGEHCNHLLRC